jgi:predicted RNase H-like HicB family nuclease
MKQRTERINCVACHEGGYAGYPTSLPMVIAQGDTLEELEKNIREISLDVLEFLKEEFEQPLEMFVVEDQFDWLHAEKNGKEMF